MANLVEELQGVHYDELIGGTAVSPIIKNVTQKTQTLLVERC